MSEQSVRSNSRLDNFEANKLASEQATYDDALYGAAGSTDFSDQAKKRAEEADAYERQLEAMQARPEGRNDDLYANNDSYQNPYMGNLQAEAHVINNERDERLAAESDAENNRLNSLMNQDVRIRQMSMIAADIARIGGILVNPENDDKLGAELGDKENRLEELLVKFSENNQLSPADAEIIMGRIIDMTDTQTEASSEVADSESTSDTAEEQSAAGPNTDNQEADDDEKAPQPVDIDAEVKDAKEKLFTEAQLRSENVVDAINDTDQAKADRELLKPVSLDGLKPLAGPDDKQAVASINELNPLAGPDSIEANKTESVDEVDEEDEDDDEEPIAPRSRRKKILSALRNPTTAAGEYVTNRDVTERQSGVVNETEKKGKRTKRVLGALALVGAGFAAGYLVFHGHDTSSIQPGNSGNGGGGVFDNVRDNLNAMADNTQDKLGTSVADIKRNGNADAINQWSFADSSSGTDLLNNHGMDPSVWYQHQDEFLKQFPELSYRMSDGNVGLLDQGAGDTSKLPKAAQAFWEKYNQ